MGSTFGISVGSLELDLKGETRQSIFICEIGDSQYDFIGQRQNQCDDTLIIDVTKHKYPSILPAAYYVLEYLDSQQITPYNAVPEQLTSRYRKLSGHVSISITE